MVLSSWKNNNILYKHDLHASFIDNGIYGYSQTRRGYIANDFWANGFCVNHAWMSIVVKIQNTNPGLPTDRL
jgi:hypothetical protein